MSLKSLSEMRACVRRIDQLTLAELKAEFPRQTKGESFSIWKNEDGTIEYVKLWKASNVHYHCDQMSVFWFLSPGMLVLGGLSDTLPAPRRSLALFRPMSRPEGCVTRFRVECDNAYHVPAFVLHAVEPILDGDVVKFVIFNTRDRARLGSNYTPDSTFFSHLKYLVP